MQIGEIIGASAVKVINSCSSKKKLFQILGEQAQSCYGFDASEIIDALVDRENLGPTGVGQGVALPHARLESLDKVCGLFVRLEKPLDFNAADRQPVDLIFTLLAPANAGVDHLKALALVARTLRDQDTCAKLRANTDAATLHMVLTEFSTTQAA